MAKRTKKPKKKARKSSDKPKRKRGQQTRKTKGRPRGRTASSSSKSMTGGRSAQFASLASVVAEGVLKKGCLPFPEAQDLVFRCGSPEADGVPSSTTLGSLFSGQRLGSFCQCVASGVPVSASKVPCGAGKTLQDVIDAIACK